MYVCMYADLFWLGGGGSHDRNGDGKIEPNEMERPD